MSLDVAKSSHLEIAQRHPGKKTGVLPFHFTKQIQQKLKKFPVGHKLNRKIKNFIPPPSPTQHVLNVPIVTMFTDDQSLRMLLLLHTCAYTYNTRLKYAER